MNQLFRSCILTLVVAFSVQSCASSGGLSSSGSKRIYSMNYESMKEKVREAIRGSQLNIDAVDEADDQPKLVLFISRSKYVGTNSTSQNQGKVVIEAVNDQQSSVGIENPDYHFTVPDHQRENYQRLLFSRLEKYEKQQPNKASNQ